jgi:hypothetical protein
MKVLQLILKEKALGNISLNEMHDMINEFGISRCYKVAHGTHTLIAEVNDQNYIVSVVNKNKQS